MAAIVARRVGNSVSASARSTRRHSKPFSSPGQPGACNSTREWWRSERYKTGAHCKSPVLSKHEVQTKAGPYSSSRVAGVSSLSRPSSTPADGAFPHLSSCHSLAIATPLHVPGLAPSCRRRNAPRLGQCQAVLDGDISQAAAFFTSQPPSWAATLGVNAVVFSLGYPVLRSGLTPSGVLSSFILGVAAWKGFGVQGYVIVCLYFLLGTAVTKVRLREKQAEGIAEQRSGRRGPGSVVGSAASAVACAVGATLGVGGPSALLLWQLGYVASFCTKLSDTTASEIGKAYGKTTYLVTTLALVPRGTEGAVSLEGTMAGLLAAAALAGVACLIGMVDPSGAVLAVGASQVANVFESWVGATSQGKQGRDWLSNDLVNVLNISMGTALAILVRVAFVGNA